MPNNHPKIYTKPSKSGYGYKHRDIGRKAESSDVETAFTCTPALKIVVFCPEHPE